MNAAHGRAEEPGPGVLAAFTIPVYRNQWMSDVLSGWATEMETIILGWYVLVATDSPFLLAVIAALRFGGTLIAPFTGVVADRVPRRTLLLVIRVAFTALAGTLAAAGITDALSLWLLFAIATGAGLLRPTEWVVRQSLIADSVPAGYLTNAMGFSRTTLESARIAGALVGAGLLSALGIGLAYVGVTLVYLASIVFTLRIAAPARRRERAPRATPLTELREGLRYMRRTPVIVVVMCLAFLCNLSALPLSHLLPAFARGTFGFDENGLARMAATLAAGALIGSILVAVLLRSARPARVMFVGLFTWHALLLWLAFAERPLLAFALLFLIGVFSVTAMIPMAVVLLGRTAAELRGRVMGVRMLAVYGLPLGLLAGGVLIERFGMTATLTAAACTGLVPIGCAALGWRRWTRATAP